MVRRSATEITLTGPLRSPAQMLADQSGGNSVHDAETAEKLGLAGAPIEGPTHFSQFEPLGAALWGDRWHSHGIISSHFRGMVFEGEQVQATATIDGPGAERATIAAHKADGSPVLVGTMSVDGDTSATVLAPRVAAAAAEPPAELFIIDTLEVGQRGNVQELTVTADDDYGSLYPFSVADKLARITESMTVHQPDVADDNPWGRQVAPIEMMSVFTNAGGRTAGFEVRGPANGLFIDLEVRMLGTPVFVGATYRVEREIVARSESKRTESYWTLSSLTDVETGVKACEVLLHQGVFKASYADYPADRLPA